MSARPELVRHQLVTARRERQDMSAFRSLILSPASLGSGSTPLVLPARARLAISHSAILAAGAVVVEIAGGRDFTNPALAANVVHRGNVAERGMSVTVQDVSAPAGTLTLYLVDHFGKHRPIATATFT